MDEGLFHTAETRFPSVRPGVGGYYVVCWYDLDGTRHTVQTRFRSERRAQAYQQKRQRIACGVELGMD
jgi:hypothetical protein